MRIKVFTVLDVSVPVCGQPGVFEVHHLRCTGSINWDKDRIPWKDHAWIPTQFAYGQFLGRLPVKIEAFLKLSFSGEDTWYDVAYFQEPVVDNQGLASGPAALLLVTFSAGSRLKFIPVTIIEGAAHLIYRGRKLQNSSLIPGTARYYVNIRVNPLTYNEGVAWPLLQHKLSASN